MLSGVAQAAGGVAYVSRQDANSLTGIDVATGAIGAPVPVASGPGEVAVSPDGRRAYVLVLNDPNSVVDNRLAVVDTASATVIASLPIGHYPRSIAVSRDGTRVYVANFGAEITVVDATTNTLTGADLLAPILNMLMDVAVSPDSARLYWTENNSGPTGPRPGAVAVYTIATGGVKRIAINDPGTITLSPDGTKAYVTNVKASPGGFSVLDLTNPAAAAVPVPGGQDVQIAVTPDGTRLYVADHDANTVTVRSAANPAAVVTTIPITAPGAIAVTPDGAQVLVVSGAAGATITKIDTLTNTTAGGFEVGAGATGLAVGVKLPAPPPATCPAGQAGTPPNCVATPLVTAPGELGASVAVTASSAPVVAASPRVLRRTIRLRTGCVATRLRVTGGGVKVTLAKRRPAGRCRLTLRVAPTATRRTRDLLVRRGGRTVRLRGVISL